MRPFEYRIVMLARGTHKSDSGHSIERWGRSFTLHLIFSRAIF